MYLTDWFYLACICFSLGKFYSQGDMFIIHEFILQTSCYKILFYFFSWNQGLSAIQVLSWVSLHSNHCKFWRLVDYPLIVIVMIIVMLLLFHVLFRHADWSNFMINDYDYYLHHYFMVDLSMIDDSNDRRFQWLMILIIWWFRWFWWLMIRIILMIYDY